MVETLQRQFVPRAIAYEPQFDQRIGLKASYLSKQIDTFIGERLNVLLSKNKYEIKNGLIYGQDIDEPFIEVMKKGVDYRRRAEGENRVDKKREEAEVEGFLKIQEIICNPNTPVGTMMLSISPQGSKNSLYQHNFYDIFTLKEDEGKRFVEARRYSSALTIDEYKKMLSLFYPKLYGADVQVDDAYLLSHPIGIKNSLFQNADQIHSYLHKDHDVTEIEEFERIKKNYQYLKEKYYSTRDPKILNAIMNKADEAAGLVNFSVELKVNDEVDFYAKQQVRTVAAGCGSSGSVTGDKKSSPFGIFDFGLEEDKYGSREFECPECGKINIRPKDELIKNCQHCGSNKVAC